MIVALTTTTKMHNEELHDFSSPSIIRMTKSRRMRWVGHLALMGAKENVCSILVGKPEGKKPLEDQDVSRWIIVMDLREIECGDMDLIDLA
jgi:hypothetical protein